METNTQQSIFPSCFSTRTRSLTIQSKKPCVSGTLKGWNNRTKFEINWNLIAPINRPFSKIPQYSLLSLQNFAQALFSISLGTNNRPKRNLKQCLCKNFGRARKSIMVCLKKAYCFNFLPSSS